MVFCCRTFFVPPSYKEVFEIITLSDLKKNDFFSTTKRTKLLFILYSINEGISSIREIGRIHGISASIVSTYMDHLMEEGLISKDHETTLDGKKFLDEEILIFKKELENFDRFTRNNFVDKIIKIACVACKSSFLISSISKIDNFQIEFLYFNSAYEILKKSKNANYFILGNVPATEFMNYGLNFSKITNLKRERHNIIGKRNHTKIAIIGKNSVSAGLFKIHRLLKNSDMKEYENVCYLDYISEYIEKKYFKRGYDLLIWEPFIEILSERYESDILYDFRSSSDSTQMLLKNNNVFLPQTFEEKFGIETEKLIKQENKEKIKHLGELYLRGEL